MTIDKLKEMVLQYRKAMKENKIPCGVVDDVKIAPRNAKYFAITQIQANGHYIIKISGIALYAGRKSLKNTILHELCHTCRGAYNHGAKFKKYGNMVYDIFGEKIETYSTPHETQATQTYKKWYNDILFMI